MHAEANGHSSTALLISSRAALRISLIPDPRSSPSNSRPASGARAPSPRDSSELSVAVAGHHIRTRVEHPDDRLPRWLRWIPRFVPLVNFALLLDVFARLRRLR